MSAPMKVPHLVRYRVRLHGHTDGPIDLPEPDSDTPWEFRSKLDAERTAQDVASLHKSGDVWCEVYEVQKTVRLLRDDVGIHVLPKPDRSPGGITLVSSRGRESTGIVVCFGPGRVLDNGEFVPTVVRAGQQVSFDPYAVKLVLSESGFDITRSMHAKAGDFAVISERDIVCVIDGAHTVELTRIG